MRHSFLVVLLLLSISVNAQLRVIGGNVIDISQRPYQAAVFVDGIFNGGGVVISPNHILTAAHVVCDGLSKVNESSITVCVGHTNLNHDVHRLTVKKVNVHSGLYYDTELQVYFNDIAVLVLSESLNFNANVQPIFLSAESNYDIGQRAVVSGWGRVGIGGALSESQLKAATATVHSCNQQNVVVQASSSTAYKGDSGGPLTIEKEGRDVLIGLVSWESILLCQCG